jgi:oxygen-dependent protoporphyrinogen oxidase
MVLLRAFLGARAIETLKGMTPADLVDKVVEELKPILQLRDKPVETHLSLYASSMSYFKPGHASLAARLEHKASETKGLYLAGNGLKGVGIPDCVASGEAAAEKIIQDFNR